MQGGGMKEKTESPVPTIHDLFPNFNEEELRRAEEKLTRYAALLQRIWDGIRNDPERLSEFERLTARESASTMKVEGSHNQFGKPDIQLS
jgi:hypothetical protein